MKKIICCFTLLFILVGCKKDNPNAQPAPDNQEQNGQQDKDIDDTNESQETPIDDSEPDEKAQENRSILTSYHSEDIDKIRLELKKAAGQIPDSKLDELEAEFKSDSYYYYQLTLSSGDREKIIPMLLAGIKRRPEQEEWVSTLLMFLSSDLRTAKTLAPEQKKEHCKYTLAYLQEAYLDLLQTSSTIEANLDDSSMLDMLHSLMAETAMEIAMEMGELELSKQIAEEMLVNNNDRNSWNYGNVIHKANTLLGRIALSDDNLENAKIYLIRSGNTPGSPQLNSFGPSFILARALLEKGEKDVVLEYLNLVAVFWANPNRNSKRSAQDHAEELLKWKHDILEGKIPQSRKWR